MAPFDGQVEGTHPERRLDVENILGESERREGFFNVVQLLVIGALGLTPPRSGAGREAIRAYLAKNVDMDKVTSDIRGILKQWGKPGTAFDEHKNERDVFDAVQWSSEEYQAKIANEVIAALAEKDRRYAEMVKEVEEQERPTKLAA